MWALNNEADLNLMILSCGGFTDPVCRRLTELPRSGLTVMLAAKEGCTGEVTPLPMRSGNG